MWLAGKEPRVDPAMGSERVDCNPSLALTTPEPSKETTRPGLPIQRVTPAQLKERRAKGLCYYCDAKWNPSHHCQGPKIYLLEGEDLTPLDTGQRSSQEEKALEDQPRTISEPRGRGFHRGEEIVT
jgi:hypothetical protein